MTVSNRGSANSSLPGSHTSQFGIEAMGRRLALLLPRDLGYLNYGAHCPAVRRAITSPLEQSERRAGARILWRLRCGRTYRP